MQQMIEKDQTPRTHGLLHSLSIAGPFKYLISMLCQENAPFRLQFINYVLIIVLWDILTFGGKYSAICWTLITTTTIKLSESIPCTQEPGGLQSVGLQKSRT